jgi:hypothetical protein
MKAPTQPDTVTIRITYSSGRQEISEGWTRGQIERLRMSWAEIREPASTATVEILGATE